MKRTLVALVALSMALTSLVGCTNKEEAENTTKKELSYWVEMPAALVSHCQSMSEVSMYKEMEKKTGVKINFIHPSTGQATEQFNLMIASREFPDLVEYAWTSYQGGPDKAINDNVIVKLNDYMKDAKNFSKILQSDKAYDSQSKTDTGLYYGFPSINGGKYRTFGGMILRQDWLDELGLAVPETIGEWEIVLRAFKEKKGATAPLTFQNDIFSTINNTNSFNNAFNVGVGMYVDNGKVKLAQLEPAYKDFIALMNKWYSEGLFDKEYDTNNATVVDAKMTNGTSGATYGYIGGTIGRYMSSMKTKDPKYKLVGAQYPVKNKGDEPRFVERQGQVANPFIAITSACKNPKVAVEWIDFLYSDEGMVLKNFGVEGETYNKVDGKYVYTDEILNNKDGLSIAEAMSKHFRANSPAPGFNQHEEYLMQYYQLQEQKDALGTWSKYADNAIETIMPPITPIMEENEELSRYSTEVSTYTSEMVLKFIKGKESMDKFDAFVANLKKMGADRIIEINQIALDRYKAR